MSALKSLIGKVIKTSEVVAAVAPLKKAGFKSALYGNKVPRSSRRKLTPSRAMAISVRTGTTFLLPSASPLSAFLTAAFLASALFPALRMRRLRLTRISPILPASTIQTLWIPKSAATLWS